MLKDKSFTYKGYKIELTFYKDSNLWSIGVKNPNRKGYLLHLTSVTKDVMLSSLEKNGLGFLAKGVEKEMAKLQNQKK